MNKKKIANNILAGMIALAVVGIGFSAYQQKIKADTILAGYGTMHLNLKVTVPESRSISVTAMAVPTSGGKRYYFKERTFTFDNPGLNSIEWYVRKIPGGLYNISVRATEGSFEPVSVQAELVNDSVTERMPFELNLGEPATVSEPSLPPAETTPNNQEEVDPSAELEQYLQQLQGEVPTTSNETPTSTTTPETNSGNSAPPVPTLPTQLQI